jgi:hypothetical protein
MTISLLAGCADPAPPHLERLVGEWGGVVAKDYSHLDGLPDDERLVRRHFESSRAMNRVLVSFLDDDPPVSNELKAFLRDWETCTSEIERIHKKMIDEQRYVYTAEERPRAEQLVKAEAVAGIELMDHLKGY